MDFFLIQASKKYSPYSRDMLVWLILLGYSSGSAPMKTVRFHIGKTKREIKRGKSKGESMVCYIYGLNHSVFRTFSFNAPVLIITLVLQTFPPIKMALGSD